MIEDELKEILEKRFAGDVVRLANQSHLHAGHSGSPGTGQSHFDVLIISEMFESLSRIQRHTFVNETVKPLFDKGLHALSLRLYTPKEYKNKT